jgi:UDP-N-acetylmuramoyl-L-alanine---L-glutamate ligase
MKIKDLINKKIVILGLGKEGISTLRVLRKYFPKKQLSVADIYPLEKLSTSLRNTLIKDKYLNMYLGTDYLKNIKNYEIIIKSPGISPFRPDVKKAIKGKVVTSQTQLFFDNYPGKIIGITGTKGKSTTTSLVYRLLKNAGFKVVTGGNLGKPILELLHVKSDYAVLELSSHQLWNLKKSPHIAIFLNIFPEHLDYSDFTSYFASKKNIMNWLTKTDYFIYNRDFPELQRLVKTCQAKLYPFGKNFLLPRNSNNPLMIGLANKLNISASYQLSKILNISSDIFKTTIQQYKPLKGRLEKIGAFNKIEFYDDCLATIPQATLNALQTFSGRIGALYLGGTERKQDYTQVINEVLKQDIPLLILFPPTGKRIQKQLKQINKVDNCKSFLVKNMKQAIELTYKYCPTNSIALFSAGAPSFGLFKNYKHRSNQYRYWVKRLSITSN